MLRCPRRLPLGLVPALLALSVPARAASFADGGAMPTARAQAAIAVDKGGAIHVLGGYVGGSTEVDEHDVLELDGGWTLATPLPIVTRGATAATGNDGVIYLVGGTGPDTQAFAYELDGGWTTLAPAEVGDSGVGPGWETSGDVGLDGKLYIFGGEGAALDDAGASIGGPNARTMIYDPTAKSWSIGAPMPAPREQHRALRGSDGNIYVFGGQDGNDFAFNTLFVYHPMTNTWTMGPPLVVPAAADAGLDAGDGGVDVPLNSFAFAASPDRRLLVVVGGSTNYLNDGAPYFDAVYLFEVATQTWLKYPVPIPAGRRDLVAAFQGCGLHVLGGATTDAVDEHDVALLLTSTTEVCNGKDDDCNGQVDEGALCTANAQGTKCVAGATPHCGCDTSSDCGAGLACDPATHLCSPADTDGGTSDGGTGADGGTIGDLDGGSSGGDGGSGDGSTADSSGCGCSVVGDGTSGGLAALASLAAMVGLVARKRRRS